MCGILMALNDGKYQKDPVNRWIIDTFQDQLERGMEGFGIVFIDKNLKARVERATEISKSLLDLYMPNNQVRMIVMHHRAPTSTQNKLKQTHPLVVNNGSLKYKYLFIHNGVISNPDEVKKMHEALGFEYTTECDELKYKGGPKKFNDSESLAIEIARFVEGQTDTLATVGSAAFVCLQVDKKTEKLIKVFYGRNIPPLNLAASRGKIRLSSEGQGSLIAEDILYEFSPKDFKIKKRKMVITKDTIREYGNYDWESYYGGYNPNTSVLGRLGEEKTGDEPANSLEEKLCEISEDGAAIADSVISDLFMKLSDPTSVLMFDDEFEIKEATKQIIVIFRDTFLHCQDVVLNDSSSKVQKEAVEELVVEEPMAVRQLAMEGVKI